MKNPIVDAWYADPEARVFDEKVHLYVTRSRDFDAQKNLDLIVSDDLRRYKVVQSILDMSTFVGATRAIWAPTIIQKESKYYLIFAANDIKSDSQVGGLYIGVSDDPKGKFTNVLPDGKPLLNRFYNGAQPIDAHLFCDDDGTVYLYYGGWGHLNVGIMKPSMDGFLGNDDLPFCEITPADYVEAPCVFKRNNLYYLMYSSGDWGNGTYAVNYCTSHSPMQGFVYQGKILSASNIADGPGHNGVFCLEGQYYIAYHRRAVGDKNPHHRKLCIDKMNFGANKIIPITMT